MAAPTKKRVLNENTEITVINNFGGKLFYRSPRTQDEFEWAEYGDEHEMTVSDLKTMKAQHKRFFEDNWIIFAEKDYDVIPFLKLEKYYTKIVTPDEIDALFDKSVADILSTLNDSTDNVKTLIFTKAKEKFQSGDLSNVHIIDAIEKTLGVEIDPARIK